jgi:hypothetical protein
LVSRDAGQTGRWGVHGGVNSCLICSYISLDLIYLSAFSALFDEGESSVNSLRWHVSVYIISLVGRFGLDGIFFFVFILEQRYEVGLAALRL